MAFRVPRRLSRRRRLREQRGTLERLPEREHGCLQDESRSLPGQSSHGRRRTAGKGRSGRHQQIAKGSQMRSTSPGIAVTSRKRITLRLDPSSGQSRRSRTAPAPAKTAGPSMTDSTTRSETRKSEDPADAPLSSRYVVSRGEAGERENPVSRTRAGNATVTSPTTAAEAHATVTAYQYNGHQRHQAVAARTTASRHRRRGRSSRERATLAVPRLRTAGPATQSPSAIRHEQASMLG